MPGKSRRNLVLLIAGLAIALGVVLFSPLASPEPDGLERVAEDQGFAENAEDSPFGILPGYTIPGVEDERVSTILAGAVGVLAVAGITLGAGRLLRRRRERREAAGAAREAEGRGQPGAPAGPGRRA